MITGRCVVVPSVRGNANKGGKMIKVEEIKCPALKIIRGGDESQGICLLVDKWCLLEGGYPCDERDIILKEGYDG